MDHLEKRAVKDYRELWDLQFDTSQTGGTTSMHAPIIYWTPSKKQSLPQYLLFNPFNPSIPPPPLLNTLLSQTLVSAFAI